MRSRSQGLAAAAWVLTCLGASAQEARLDPWPAERAADLEALQSGARTFANACGFLR